MFSAKAALWLTYFSVWMPYASWNRLPEPTSGIIFRWRPISPQHDGGTLAKLWTFLLLGSTSTASIRSHSAERAWFFNLTGSKKKQKTKSNLFQSSYLTITRSSVLETCSKR